MILSYDDVKLIVANNESFKMKHQRFGNSIVAQCTYFLASTGDFFPEIIVLEENNEKISLYGELVFNNKKLKDMNDDEIKSLGFDFLKQFKFSDI